MNLLKNNTDDRPDILVLVDFQNDFITGALANPEAEKIINLVAACVGDIRWKRIYATRDAHIPEIYYNTAEGSKFPIHCIKGEWGFMIRHEVFTAFTRNIISPVTFVNKDTYLSDELLETIEKDFGADTKCNIYVCGLCTDICVLMNAANLNKNPNYNVFVYQNLCAGTTPEKHKNACKMMEDAGIVCMTYVLNGVQPAYRDLVCSRCGSRRIDYNDYCLECGTQINFDT